MLYQELEMGAILVWKESLNWVRTKSVFNWIYLWLHVNYDIILYAGNEVIDEFDDDDETDILVTPSPRPNKRKTSKWMCFFSLLIIIN